jgi:hypothetical protein
MERDPRKDADEAAKDALSGFNADEILRDPDDLETDHEKREPAATPDSPNPI